ncbi:hypothetical protein [Leptospira levettii]|uniref:hypothetical protein n=1 Tax=Leptospira levettii TaxID=2023178 RepID=UPI003EC0986D
METNDIITTYINTLPQSIAKYNPEFVLFPLNTKFKKAGKVLKKPSEYALYGDLKNKDNFTQNYIERLIKNSQFHNLNEFKSVIQGNMNLGIILEYSDILVLDIDNDGQLIQGTDMIHALDMYRFKNEKIRSYIDTLIDLITSNQSARVDTGSGEHYYFHFPKEIYNGRKVKCLNLKNIFKDEDLASNPFILNGIEYRSLEEVAKLKQDTGIDILADDLVVAPGSQFFVDGKKVKCYTWKGRGKSNYELPTLDPELLFNLFDLTEPKSKKKRKNSSHKQLEEDEYVNEYAFLDNITIDEISGNPEYESIVALDSELQTRFNEYLEAVESGDNTRISETIRRFEVLKQILIENSNYNADPLSFFTMQKRRKLRLMNEYVKSQKRYFNNSPILDKVETVNYQPSDRSKFEYGYIARSVIMNTPIEIIKQNSEHFNDNAKMKTDIGFIDQAYGKLEEDFRIDPNSNVGQFNRLILQARKTNFSKIFGRSHNSAKLIYMYLLNLASGRLNFTIIGESSKTISLGSTVSDRTVIRTLKLLMKKGYIHVNFREFESKTNQVFLFIGSIVINSELVTETDQSIILENSHTSFDFEELVFMAGIGKIGATLYQSLLRNGSMTLKEIYRIFPNYKNVYTSVKPVVLYMLECRFIVFDEVTDLYSINYKDNYLNMIKAKEKEIVKKIQKKKPNVKTIQNPDVTLSTIEKRIIKYENDRNYWNTNSGYVLRAS